MLLLQTSVRELSSLSRQRNAIQPPLLQRHVTLNGPLRPVGHGRGRLRLFRTQRLIHRGEKLSVLLGGEIEPSLPRADESLDSLPGIVYHHLLRGGELKAGFLGGRRTRPPPGPGWRSRRGQGKL